MTASTAPRIRIITASAGSGKTYRLTEILDEAIASGRVRPDGVAAVTFTRQAAAELVERARSRLLGNGRALDAHRLLAARIGTVNAVCGSLVAEFAFELGMSPAVQVLDEVAAEREFRRAVGGVVPAELADELERYKRVFEQDLDWRAEVRRIVEGARANGISAEGLAACAERSQQELDACLGPVTADDLDAELEDALAESVRLLEANPDAVKKTHAYLELLRRAKRELPRRRLRWGDWCKLANEGPSTKLAHFVEPVQEIAGRHREHPRLRAEMKRCIEHLFGVAASALAAYQAHKRALGVIDFVDQEALALELLRRDDVRAQLAGQIDLFLVDEFQDTSPIQLAVFLELAQLATESIWVGDPKQAIYGFRGTDPALMDAAIESLTSLTTDGDLVAAAADAVARGTLETLPTSYRSRPALVHVTSEVFARAFERQGMPPERTRLVPHLVTEPAGLGEIVEYWPLVASNADKRANAVVAGVRELLARGAMIRDRDDRPRPVRRGDIAVLCRKNDQCRSVAAAFGALGIPAVVPRTGLLDTLEAMVARAGLVLWADPRDAVARAELARIVTYPEDLDAVVAHALAHPGSEAFAGDPVVARVLAAREAERDLGPVAALDAVLAATELRRLCAEWGSEAQRLGNLDALRAHAIAYVQAATAAGDAPTIFGLLAYLDELGAESSWKDPRTDRQALLAGEDAVTISTWHAAKGLEWPVTVLFGLESQREPRTHGVHVVTDRTAFDVADPLGGRWIRYWPNPYTNTQQKGPVREAFEASPAHAILVERAAREALRVIYVGWTRARDRLVFASAPGKLRAGILGALAPELLSEPGRGQAEVASVSWAGVRVDVRVAPCTVLEPGPVVAVPGEVTLGRDPVPRARARALPSEAPPVPCTLGELVELGPRLAVTNRPDMEQVGHAVHAFLAADRPGLSDAERLAIATDLLAGFGVAESLDAHAVVAAASRFWAWIAARFPGAQLHREWPIAQRTAAGTVVSGTADLVLDGPDGLVVIDHKTFPGGDDAALDRARGYSGQLAAYASALAAAHGTRPRSTWIHFPVLGRLVEVVVPVRTDFVEEGPR